MNLMDRLIINLIIFTGKMNHFLTMDTVFLDKPRYNVVSIVNIAHNTKANSLFFP